MRRSVVEYGPLASILPNPINPRKHSRQQIEAIARSIEAFGFNAPILVDSEKRVVAGHARLEAARLLALQEVRVIRLDHLTEAQAKAYMLADNKLTDRSSWDDRKVAIVLKELSDIALDFEIDATGFEPPEIDLRIQSLEPPENSPDSADEFEASEDPIGETVGNSRALPPPPAPRETGPVPFLALRPGQCRFPLNSPERGPPLR
jgi:ParB-like chromosome segregation protein Spo0J